MAGYIGNSMSVRACEAHAEGRKPITGIEKKHILEYGVSESLAFFSWYVIKHIKPIKSNEWHHTSAWYNETNYYNIKDCCAQFKKLKKKDIENLKSQYKIDKQKRKQEKMNPKIEINDEPYYAKVNYSISLGPKRSRKYFVRYAIVYKSEAYIKDDYKNKIIGKELTGKHFSIKEKFQSRPEEMPEDLANEILGFMNKKLKVALTI